MRINTDEFSWRLFQSVRVLVLAAIGNMFFRLASFKETLRAIKQGFSHWNPWIFFDGSLYESGISDKDFRVTIVGLLILLAISVIQKKQGGVRVLIAKNRNMYSDGVRIHF